MILLAMAASFGFGALGILLIVLRPRFRRQASRVVVRWNALRTLVLPALIGALGWWLSGLVAVGLVALVAFFLRWLQVSVFVHLGSSLLCSDPDLGIRRAELS